MRLGDYLVQVNEGVREKENSERLEWIQSHVHCDGPVEVSCFFSFKAISTKKTHHKILF